LGASIENDGNLIRVRLPQMSAERRSELVKILHKKLEEAKIAIRNVRKDFQNLVRDSEKKKDISEDHSRRLAEVLQKITDKFCQVCDEISAKKEKDIAF
jgi:ribosome recycling factor